VAGAELRRHRLQRVVEREKMGEGAPCGGVAESMGIFSGGGVS
jgi:hypothetical protein